ncbi:MAG: T9SS type A sorting domain-containing protein, partial [Bacteroidota bacterium]
YINNSEPRVLQLFINGQLVDERDVPSYGSAGAGNASAINSAGDFFPSTDCTPSFLFTQTVLDASSSEEVPTEELIFKREHDLMLFPNPSFGKLSLAHMGAEKGKVHVSLSDIQGQQLILREIEPQEQLDLDLSTFSRGVYLLMVQVQGRRYVRRVVLQ